ncbi:hypothetical protein NEOLEDRAFT_1056746 [Neolentinus lepideus HHB14362 ss-1]|uniref:Uncharacterized protein n=1 Tax=Neolentinus lepideus HHB14362 ss-1 TaxID=1314782 RepID=A0A165VBV3_9AGAM|nr:hypothetical protein NEOLEDRAFT_1056746 [Neolentinus lepideus HHB14362 ss-1]
MDTNHLDPQLVPPESTPGTPESPTNSLLHATMTIDDLTLALTNFSRAPSPDPPAALSCCCGNAECDNVKEWMRCKSKLEGRLTLSAEVGQALLRRHEVYVRRNEPSQASELEDEDEIDPRTREELESRVSFLVKENAVLEKRLAHSMVNSEVVESSNKTALQELTDARAEISRLQAQHARSVGWDTRLAVIAQEKDDLQQERDSEAHRARMAEVRLAALKEKSTKLQLEVRRLYKELEKQRSHRLELSEEILQDARSRLESLQHYQQFGHSTATEDPEVTKVLESLVANNEALKHDNAELQNILAELREEYRSLQEEVEEQRAMETPHSRHRVTNSQSSITYIRSPNLSASSALSPLSSTFFTGRRAPSAERSVPRKTFEPLTPETDRRPLSPTDDTKLSYPQSRNSPPREEKDVEEDTSPEHAQSQKPFLLLSRSKAVQTEPTWSGLLAPSPAYSTISPGDGHSESSSLTDSHQGSALGSIIERVNTLLNRLTQADAFTLTNRLKRQHLHGADVGHLSRSTVDAIVHEVAGLRAQYRALLEDEKVVVTCTRKELRALFKVLRETFVEMGQMRVTLNDVILDPSIAPKVRDMAMNPAAPKDGSAAPSSGPASWIAPISKLFGGVGAAESKPSPPLRPTSARGRPTAKLVPKLGPALSASATTVNVEFSGGAVGRAVSSSHAPVVAPGSGSESGAGDVSRSLMGIFAGAPRPAEGDPWIVVPKEAPSAIQRTRSHSRVKSPLGTTTIGRRGPRPLQLADEARLSRNVDAVIDVHSPQAGSADHDDDEGGFQRTLLERTLKPRGFSDSSIHTTFMNHSEDGDVPPAGPAGRQEGWPDRQSVLQALSRKMQSFRLGGAVGASVVAAGAVAQPVAASAPLGPGAASSPIRMRPERAASPGLGGLMGNLSSMSAWSAGELEARAVPHFVGSPMRGREDDGMWRETR